MTYVDAVEQAADQLYGLPLGEFTSARDELTRSLRRQGLRSEAEAVKALRKPTIAAWTLNQLARRRPRDFERLLATGKRLRTAQKALLAGEGRSALQTASAEERRLITELARDATAVAGEAGTAGTESLHERIRATLHAAALDERTAAELAAGRLVREHEAVGLFGTAPAEAGPAPKAAPSPKQAPDHGAVRKVAERHRELERGLATAQAAEKKAQREHAAAVKVSERAARLAEDARRRADEARARADEARAGLREAERRERDAASAHERATRAVAAAEKKLAQRSSR
jgi:hypothetical protein